MKPLVMKSHLKQYHCREMASRSSADHLTIIYEPNVTCSHSIDVLIIFIIDNHNSSVPALLLQEASYPFFSITAPMDADYSGIVFKRRGL